VALGVAGIAREKNKVFVGSGAGTSVLPGAQCSPNTVHWTYDTWALGNSLGQAIVGEGGKKWFFLTADYAFGKDLEKSAADAVTAAGGQVVGAARHPIATADFSSFLLQAQASGADVVGFANAGDDLGTSLKQAAEFGLAKNQRLAALIFNITNIPGIGLKNVQELELVTGYYWDLNDDTRAFAKRFQERHPRKNMPNDMQAGIYAATIHYLKAVVRLKSAADGRAVVETMKALPTDDPIFGKGSIRADGRKLHNMYLFEVKSPAESSGPWDCYKLRRTIPPEEVFRSLAARGCSLV
jgi:branched-chain amino acid transport system substrate-binding protein